MKGSAMRKLPISILALLAGLAFSPFLLAAGMDTGPGPNARPVDPDYESGKKAIEAQNWKVALDSFARVASREPSTADVQNYLGDAGRKSVNLDLPFSHHKEALRCDPPQKSAHHQVAS